jgi:hypothetical protein
MKKTLMARAVPETGRKADGDRTETGRTADFGGRRTGKDRKSPAKSGKVRLLEKRIFLWLYRRVSREPAVVKGTMARGGRGGEKAKREGRLVRLVSALFAKFAFFRLLVGREMRVARCVLRDVETGTVGSLIGAYLRLAVGGRGWGKG